MLPARGMEGGPGKVFKPVELGHHWPVKLAASSDQGAAAQFFAVDTGQAPEPLALIEAGTLYLATQAQP